MAYKEVSFGQDQFYPILQSDLIPFVEDLGWTVHTDQSFSQRSLGFSKNMCHVQIKFWTGSTAYQEFSLSQSLGYVRGEDAGSHPGDSGSGPDGIFLADILAGRGVQGMADTPGTCWFFGGDDYVHVVVERDDRYRHWGFGHLNKFGQWSGGEYCYGHRTVESGSSPDSEDHSLLLEGRPALGNRAYGSTVLLRGGLENLPNGWAWGILGEDDEAPGTDSEGNARASLMGGTVGTLFGATHGSNRIPGTYVPGQWVPMYQNCVWYFSGSGSNTVQYLGTQPDVACLNLGPFTNHQEIVVGQDRWKLFPATRRVADSTGNLGVAYRMVTE